MNHKQREQQQGQSRVLCGRRRDRPSGYTAKQSKAGEAAAAAAALPLQNNKQEQQSSQAEKRGGFTVV